MRLLESFGHSTEAMISGAKVLKQYPSLALGFAVAQELRAAGDIAGAVQTLSFASQISSFAPDEWGLAHEVAQFLTSVGRPARAFAIYNNLLLARDLPRELHAGWQREADAAALAAKLSSGQP